MNIPKIEEILDILEKADSGEIGIIIDYEEHARIMQRDGGCLKPYGPGPMWAVLPVKLANGWIVDIQWKRGFAHYVNKITFSDGQIIDTDDHVDDGDYSQLLWWRPDNDARWLNVGPIIECQSIPEKLMIEGS